MSPRRRRITVEDDVEATRAARLPILDAPPVAPAPPLVPTLVEERDDAELDAVLEQLGTDGRVKVWNLIEGKGQYAGEMSMDGFTLDLLMDTYGGGDKTLAFYQSNRRVRSVRVSLDANVPIRNPRIKPLPPGAPVPAPATQPFDAAAAMLAGMAAIMKASADNSTMMVGMMAEIAKARAPEANPMEIVKAVVEMMKSSVPPPPVAPAPGLGVKEAFELFEKGMSVANKLGGGGDDDGTTGLIREGIGAVGKIAEAIITNRGVASPVAVVEPTESAPDAAQLELPGTVAPSTAAVRAPGSAVTPPPPMAKPIQPSRAWHRAVIAHYDDLKMAARFMSGDTAAVELLRRMPEPAPGEDDVLDDLLDDLEDETPPGFIARTAVAFPELALSPEWVAQFHETLKDNMVEDGEEDTTARENGVGATNPSLTRPSLTG